MCCVNFIRTDVALEILAQPVMQRLRQKYWIRTYTKVWLYNFSVMIIA
jgi:hypothetical protein